MKKQEGAFSSDERVPTELFLPLEPSAFEFFNSPSPLLLVGAQHAALGAHVTVHPIYSATQSFDKSGTSFKAGRSCQVETLLELEPPSFYGVQVRAVLRVLLNSLESRLPLRLQIVERLAPTPTQEAFVTLH